MTLDRTHGETQEAAQEQGGRNKIINLTTPFSCFFKKEPTLPQMPASVGNGSVVLRAVALVETAFLKILLFKFY